MLPPGFDKLTAAQNQLDFKIDRSMNNAEEQKQGPRFRGGNGVGIFNQLDGIPGMWFLGITLITFKVLNALES